MENLHESFSDPELMRAEGINLDNMILQDSAVFIAEK
jgi:hypothetical protein